MTSLFRRSSSGSGGGGGGGGATGARGTGTGAGDGSPAPQELNNSRPARQVRRLEFNQAMDDFKTMFPNMDYDIIECVLRANSGAVDATIDQLLQMNLEAGGGSAYEDSSDSEDSIPPEVEVGPGQFTSNRGPASFSGPGLLLATATATESEGVVG